MKSNVDHNKKNAQTFNGPLFIVGMPRSGTKLIRDLLNNNSLVFIPEIETNFLPKWKKNWEKYGELSQIENFKKFYNRMKTYTYFLYMKENKKVIQYYEWYNLCKNYAIPDLFEALIRHDTNSTDKADAIWGDKSPDYIRFIPLLNELFPNARFIHIIRDARDYCLSINRAWGKNMLRAAQRWRDNVSQAQKYGIKLKDKYMEIKYEELITDPEIVLIDVCNFLNLKYDKKMILLKKAVDKIGDSKEIIGIKSDNKYKYVNKMELKIKNEIESIAGNVLRKNRYHVDYSGETKTISSITMVYYQFLDVLNRLKFDIKHKGIGEGVKWTVSSLLSQLKI